MEAKREGREHRGHRRKDGPDVVRDDRGAAGRLLHRRRLRPELENQDNRQNGHDGRQDPQQRQDDQRSLAVLERHLCFPVERVSPEIKRPPLVDPATFTPRPSALARRRVLKVRSGMHSCVLASGCAAARCRRGEPRCLLRPCDGFRASD